MSSDQPFLSIITVVYNGGKTIQKTIESVLSQNCPILEYIIIDAMSTDNTPLIVSKYGDRIIYIREKDKGLYDAMNKGIKIARGEVIGIINADDFYLPRVFDEIIKIFKKYKNIGIVHGNTIDNEQNGFHFESKPYPINLLAYGMCIKHPTCFVRKMVYNEIGAFDISYKIAADYDFVLRTYIKGYHFHYLNKPIVSFYRGGISERRRFLGSFEQLRSQKNNGCKNLFLGFFVFIYGSLVKPLFRQIISLLFNFRYGRKL